MSHIAALAFIRDRGILLRLQNVCIIICCILFYFCQAKIYTNLHKKALKHLLVTFIARFFILPCLALLSWEKSIDKLPIIVSCSGLLSHAVVPPTTEHVYAQWCEWDGPCKRVDQTVLDGSNSLLAGNTEEASSIITPLAHSINSKINRKIFKGARPKSKGKYASQQFR